MVTQYPHYLFRVENEDDSYQDEHGNWIGGGTKIVYLSRCREEVNGNSQQIQKADGTYWIYSSLIQLPKGRKALRDGDMILVSNDPEGNDIRIKAECGRISFDQMHSRIWV